MSDNNSKFTHQEQAQPHIPDWEAGLFLVGLFLVGNGLFVFGAWLSGI